MPRALLDRRRYKHTLTHTRVQTDRDTCGNAHTATYTYIQYMRAQVCCLSHQGWQHVRQPVVGTAVRLLSVRETLSSLLLSHRKPPCPAASILRWQQSKRVFLTRCTDKDSTLFAAAMATSAHNNPDAANRVSHLFAFVTVLEIHIGLE